MSVTVTTPGATVHLSADHADKYSGHVEQRNLRVVSVQGNMVTCAILPPHPQSGSHTVVIDAGHLVPGGYPMNQGNAVWGPAA